MRIALAVALLIALASPAAAHPAYDYVGGCGLVASSDGTDSPQTEWHGEIHAAVVGTETSMGTPVALPVRVECELRVGTTTRGSVDASGTGVAGGVATLSFRADPDEVFMFCETVTVAGETHQHCDAVPLVPEPIQEFVEEIRTEVEQIHTEYESFVCPALMSQAHGPLDQPPAFEIRSDGDVYVTGRLVFDCVPYGESGT